VIIGRIVLDAGNRHPACAVVISELIGFTDMHASRGAIVVAGPVKAIAQILRCPIEIYPCQACAIPSESSCWFRRIVAFDGTCIKSVGEATIGWSVMERHPRGGLVLWQVIIGIVVERKAKIGRVAIIVPTALWGIAIWGGRARQSHMAVDVRAKRSAEISREELAGIGLMCHFLNPIERLKPAQLSRLCKGQAQIGGEGRIDISAIGLDLHRLFDGILTGDSVSNRIFKREKVRTAFGWDGVDELDGPACLRGVNIGKKRVRTAIAGAILCIARDPEGINTISIKRENR